MRLFRYFDHTIASEIDLPELTVERTSLPVHSVLRGSTEPAVTANNRNLELEDGTVWATLHRGQDCWVIRINGVASFSISDDGRQVVCHFGADTPISTVRYLLLNQVLPLAIAHSGAIVLHGSAVCIGGQVVAFVGGAGRGKSTLAASFASAQCSVLSDDSLLIDREGNGFSAVGSYADLRLWSDSAQQLFPFNSGAKVSCHYSDKRHFVAEPAVRFHSEPAPLRRIFIVEPDLSCATQEVSIGVTGPVDTLAELIRYTYRLDIRDYPRLLTDQHFLANLIERDLVRRLKYPKAYSHLSLVRQAILSDLGSKQT